MTIATDAAVASATARHDRSRWRGALAPAAVGLACAVVLWWRLPAAARGTFWAEDGRDFVSNAAQWGVGALFRPYAGYLHIVPRMIATTVVHLPVPVWAVAVTAACCAVTGVLGAAVFIASRDVVPWLPARVAVAGLTVLAPLGPREVLGNLANLHSVFLWAMFWVLLVRPRGRAGTLCYTTVTLLGALTEIQALMLLPLLALRPHRRRVWTVRAGMLAGLVAQVFVTIGWPRHPDPHPPLSALSVAYGYVVNAAMPLATPQPAIGPVLQAVGPIAGIVVLAGVTAAGGYTLWVGTRAQKVAVLAASALSAASYTAGVVMNPSDLYAYVDLTPHGLRTAWLARYGVVPSMLLASVVFIAAAAAHRHGVSDSVRGVRPDGTRQADMRLATRTVLTGAAVLAVLLAAQGGTTTSRRTKGPVWAPQVPAAARTCADDPGRADVHLAETIHWTVRVPCRDLTGP